MAKAKQKVTADQLAPGLAEGFTSGISKEEALEQFPVEAPRTNAELIGHMAEVKTVAGTRIPLPRFVAESSNEAVWTDGVTDRKQMDVHATFQPETISAFQAGMICLRCYEPQPHAFPPGCDLCGYPIGERQIVDFAMEFEGGKHIGPSKPISEYMQEGAARDEKRKFDRKIREGGSPMKGLR